MEDCQAKANGQSPRFRPLAGAQSGSELAVGWEKSKRFGGWIPQRNST